MLRSSAGTHWDGHVQRQERQIGVCQERAHNNWGRSWQVITPIRSSYFLWHTSEMFASMCTQNYLSDISHPFLPTKRAGQISLLLPLNFKRSLILEKMLLWGRAWRRLWPWLLLLHAACRLFIRCERQTLSRLPKSGAILFTIRTYVRPLREYLESDKDSLRRLYSAVQNLPEVWVSFDSFSAVQNLHSSFLCCTWFTLCN